MTQETLKQMYQLLLTEPHAPTVCAQLERIAREALAQPEQEPVAWVAEAVCDGQYIDGRPRKIWWECKKGVGTAFYITPPQRKPLTDKAITQVIDSMPKKMKGFMVDWDLYDFARAIEAAHGIKENT